MGTNSSAPSPESLHKYTHILNTTAHFEKEE